MFFSSGVKMFFAPARRSTLNSMAMAMSPPSCYFLNWCSLRSSAAAARGLRVLRSHWRLPARRTCGDIATAFYRTIEKMGFKKDSRCGYAIASIGLNRLPVSRSAM